MHVLPLTNSWFRPARLVVYLLPFAILALLAFFHAWLAMLTAALITAVVGALYTTEATKLDRIRQEQAAEAATEDALAAKITDDIQPLIRFVSEKPKRSVFVVDAVTRSTNFEGVVLVLRGNYFSHTFRITSPRAVSLLSQVEVGHFVRLGLRDVSDKRIRSYAHQIAATKSWPIEYISAFVTLKPLPLGEYSSDWPSVSG